MKFIMGEESHKGISKKDVQQYHDWVACQGHIGFRTPTQGESFARLEWYMGKASGDFISSLRFGYRKHAFVLRQIGVVRHMGIECRVDAGDYHIYKNYID